MKTLPPLPPDSPWFMDNCSEPCYLTNTFMWLFSDYANWPAHIQAEAAAVAAMEWDTHYEEETGYYQARDAFRVARERMRGEPT